MPDVKRFFELLSYLQYPFMLIGTYFAIRPMLSGALQAGEIPWEDFNLVLVFMGLGISFSTMQDTSKVQNEASLKVYQDPKKSRLFVSALIFATLLCFIVGLVGIFSSPDAALRELCTGILMVGIGLLGMIKLVFEMIENHGPKSPV